MALRVSIEADLAGIMDTAEGNSEVMCERSVVDLIIPWDHQGTLVHPYLTCCPYGAAQARCSCTSVGVGAFALRTNWALRVWAKGDHVCFL